MLLRLFLVFATVLSMSVYPQGKVSDLPSDLQNYIERFEQVVKRGQSKKIFYWSGENKNDPVRVLIISADAVLSLWGSAAALEMGEIQFFSLGAYLQTKNMGGGAQIANNLGKLLRTAKNNLAKRVYILGQGLVIAIVRNVHLIVIATVTSSFRSSVQDDILQEPSQFFSLSPVAMLPQWRKKFVRDKITDAVENLEKLENLN